MMDEQSLKNKQVADENIKKLYAYCLFCETQRCKVIAEQIQRKYGYTCFSPRIIQRKWIRGNFTEESHDWLPGYVFLYTEKPVIPRFDINGIIRSLGNGELNGSDFAFAQMLYNKGGILGQVYLLNEGDRCKVADPSWLGIRGKVKKIDRGRKRCCLEFEFDDIKRSIWVGYEMLKPDE